MITYGAYTNEGMKCLAVIGELLPISNAEVVQIGFAPDDDQAHIASQEILARGGTATTLIGGDTAAACGKPGMIIVVESTLVKART